MTQTDTNADQPLATLLETLARIAPRSDETGVTDPASITALRESGVLNASLPVELGGQGQSPEAIRHLLEQIGRADASIGIIYFQHLLVIDNLLRWGSEAQKAAYLRRLASGEFLAAAAWSESGANRPTIAEPHPAGGYVLTGLKTYTTGAGLADLYLLPAEVREAGNVVPATPSQTFFLLQREHIHIPEQIGYSLSGMRGSSTGWIELKGAHVPETAVFGAVGGAGAIKGNLWRSGQSLGAVALGISRAAFALFKAHVKARGLESSSAIRVKLTELDTRIHAIAAFVTLAARGDAPAQELPAIVSEAKIFASETAEVICREVQQQIGSFSYTRGAEIERLWRDARGIALMGPANHLMAEMLGSQLAAG
ncbi:acyl-CoA dehydrogenase [Paracoccus limosus]|uniref:Acyl-CoA dehydrogenase n=1 Tax=Paracoccus limosus TaxID=913252 RepID=A0A844H4Z8_9RHOB|nr:acyl-CoA dehydrogenase [Paracoccus limosus]